ncbi:ribulokinase [Virgibacillus dakarensis]|uniref:ribulokinase n=1 Tax=Virgibacillus dakarensis TaxID=1917889 RepID=UPI000B44832A|nr:ribulokinase [Virgibacillus dakarensis]
MAGKYVIGVDFGTESGRAVLVSVDGGEEIASHVTRYKHGVIDQELPESGIKLNSGWALQHPLDYLDVVKKSIPKVIQDAKIPSSEIIGLGIAFTSCTMLPIGQNGDPLCINPQFKDNPHSWVKLWKHHAAHKEANQLNDITKQIDTSLLNRYGGKISSEWMIPKLWQILKEAPDLYESTDLFVEASDWVTYKLTNNFVRNSCAAGYKSLWAKRGGYPSKQFFKSLDNQLEDLTCNKLRGEIFPSGTRAGGLTKEMALLTGLNEGLAVAVGNVDAHVSVPGMGVTEPGTLVMTMGTSICHLLLGNEEKQIKGICGVVEDGIIPGYYGYEAGQPAVGDIFAWYINRAVPAYIHEEATAKGISIHQLLEEKAADYNPGESGLLALDWWNGNRSILVDADVSGLLLGMNLQTKPEEIYRTLLESTAFGTRRILDEFSKSGLEVNELYVCGGLTHNNRLLMQIYADVTNRVIKIADSAHISALGAAMFGAVAAGEENGGYNSIIEASKEMASMKNTVIKPIPQNVKVYEKIYKEYSLLHDYFGEGENDVMKQLRAIQLGNKQMVMGST